MGKRKMKLYNVTGEITLHVNDIEVEATSKQEAIELVQERANEAASCVASFGVDVDSMLEAERADK